MERISSRFLVGWLMVALALAMGIVGCGAVTHHDNPSGRSGLLEECELSTGQGGLLYDDLCLPAPPAGWTGPRQKATKTSLLKFPQAVDCPRIRPCGVFLEF